KTSPSPRPVALKGMKLPVRKNRPGRSEASQPIWPPTLAPSAAPTAPGLWKVGLEGSSRSTRPTVPMSDFGSSIAVGGGARWAQPTGPSITSAATKTASGLIDRRQRATDVGIVGEADDP